MALDTSVIIGAGCAGGAYDGSYKYNTQTELIDAKIKLTVPAGVPLVQGVPAQPQEWSFEIEASFPRETTKTPIRVPTPFGDVTVVIRFLRQFPD